MNASEITCPKCHQTIALTAAIEGPIVERLQAAYAAQAAEREAAFKAREEQIASTEQALKRAQADVQQQVEERLAAERERIAAEQQLRAKAEVVAQMRDLEAQVAEQAKKLTDAQQAQLQVLRDRRQLEEQRQAFQLEKVKQIESERQAIASEQERKVKEQVAVQISDLQNELAEKAKRLAEAQQAELQLNKEKRALAESKQAFEVEKAKQIELERDQIRADARRAAEEQAAKDMLAITEKLAAKDRKLVDAQQAELKLLKERAEFEERQQSFSLELARQAETVKENVKKAKDEEFRLREAEYTKQMEDVKRQLDEARRKAEQGSQQVQGEVLELDLEAALRRCFPGDAFTPVAKGIHGGDILHLVRGDLGHDCGTIVWESKRTKAWSDGWLQKLKDDRLAAKATLAILVTAAMPKDAATFECREGIWVTPPALAVPLAAALRLSMIETAAVHRSIEGRQDKMESVYTYLSGPEFKGRVSAIVDSFTSMREDLDTEKKAIQRLWAKREKQLDRVLTNTSGLHGDLAGIIGRQMPTIESLDFAALPDGEAVVVTDL